MAKKKRQRMFSREQRQANRAAIVAERGKLGEEAWQLREDIALIDAIGGVDANSAGQLAELTQDADDGYVLGDDLREAVARQFERVTGKPCTPENLQAVIDEAEDRAEAEAEMRYFQQGGF